VAIFTGPQKRHDQFYLAVCDSTGHGVPGAFMSLLNVSFLNEAVSEKNIKACNEILNYTRERLISSVSQDGAQDGMDGILLSFIKKGNSKHDLRYAAAYNSPVLVRNGRLISLQADKMPIGKGERSMPFNVYEVNAQQGDVLYLFTDGYADQFGGAKEKKFKYKQLNELLVSISHLSMEEQRFALEQRFEEWRGILEQVDDLCVIGIRI
jgi:serine phosphatase RsbU (regulator of sigma subunit)